MSVLQELKDQEKTAKLLAKKFDGTITDANGTFESRNTNRVDKAQLKAEEYLNKAKIPYKNIGFDSKEDRIPSHIWFKTPEFLRCMPDMFFMNKRNEFNFLEIKGCREDAKFKQADILQYSLWNGIAPLYFFIFDVKSDRTFLLSFETLMDKMGIAEIKRYDDNNKIYFSYGTALLYDYERTMK